MILEINATGMYGSELQSLPHRLRYLLAWDHALSRAVLAVSARDARVPAPAGLLLRNPVVRER